MLDILIYIITYDINYIRMVLVMNDWVFRLLS